MLAEELMQSARRQWWDDTTDTTGASRAFAHAPGSSVADQCEAARVFCRLAVLHRDEDYRQAAILADADYTSDAERTLAALPHAVDALGDTAGLYGLALTELFALRDLQ